MSRRKRTKQAEVDPTMTTPFPGGDGAVLREWLERERIVVKPWYRLPTPEACDELIRRIDHTRELFLDSTSDWARSARHRKEVAGTALCSLADILPDWEAEARGDVEDLSQLDEPREMLEAEQRLRKVRALRAAVEDALDHSTGYLFELTPWFRKWHQFVAFLVEDFTTAMRSTNQNPPGINNNDGPLGKFLEDVIPYVSGEKPRRAAIMQHLRRMP